MTPVDQLLAAQETERRLEPLLPLVEVRRLLGISRPTLSRLLRAGELATVWVGKRRFVHPDDLRAFIEERREPARSP